MKIIQRNGKISHAFGLEELIFFKMPYYSKQFTDLFNTYKITHDIFHRTKANIPKTCMEPKRPRIAKQSRGKRTKPVV